MIPGNAETVKRPYRGKYYFEHKHRHGESRGTSLERGELTFPEWKDAYSQFLSEGISEKEKVNQGF